MSLVALGMGQLLSICRSLCHQWLAKCGDKLVKQFELIIDSCKYDAVKTNLKTSFIVINHITYASVKTLRHCLVLSWVEVAMEGHTMAMA